MSDLPPFFKTSPRAHQMDLFEKHCDDERFALHWEMGLGKTWELLTIMSYLYTRNKIDAVLVLAPNSVYSNWLTQEAPKHLAVPYAPFRYRVGGSDKKVAKRSLYLMPDVINPREKLRLVCMSYSAMITEDGFEFAQRLVSLYRTKVICDESSKIKNGSTQTAKKAKKLGKLCHYRWNATGTPISRAPFDVHSQIEMLDEDYWSRYGCRSLQAFKNEFAVYGKKEIYKGGKAIEVPMIVDYKNLEKLNRWLAPICSRLLKEDSGVELPPKVYKTITFEMKPEQKKAYESLRKSYLAELDSGGKVEAPLAIVRLTRLKQIASGFVKVKTPRAMEEFHLVSESGDVITPIVYDEEVVDVVPPGQNPRIDALLEVLELCERQVIVWCAFTRSVDTILELLNQDGERAVRYDGKTDERERERNLARWRSGESQVLVANTRTISMGLTLVETDTLIYYENTFVLEDRLQSEDRAHRIGQVRAVNIVDLVAEGTVDEMLLENLTEKHEIARVVNGDRYREWLSLSPSDDSED